MMNMQYSSCRCGCQNNRANPIPRNTGAYTISLDSASSILHPAEGQFQRFCYQVTPNAFFGTREYLLNYVVLGIADTIGAGDFDSLTVSVNGVNQPVSWGTNTFLVSPDAGNACSGLKLMFPLTNASDVMRICFSLKTAYAVNGISVCLQEGDQAVASQSVPGPAAQQEGDCPTTTYQEVDVCVPVTVAPFATVGDVQVSCCGEPTITQGTASCSGTVGGTCAFTISQRVCIAVPVAFGANAQVGDYAVNCGTAASGNCENCGAESGNGAAGFTVAGQTFLNDVVAGGVRRCIR